jgi:hypothetical protein
VPIKYPYFFLDPAGHGYGWVGLQFVQLGIIFGVLGAAVVGLDRLGAAIGGPPTAEAAGPPVQRTESEPAALS